MAKRQNQCQGLGIIGHFTTGKYISMTEQGLMRLNAETSLELSDHDCTSEPCQCISEMNELVKRIIASRPPGQTTAIYVLQNVQGELGYIPQSSITAISKQLRIPEIEILGVATFYEQFRFTKPGKYTIKVCEGTACHVKGGAKLAGTIEETLKIKAGETTEDGRFSLERVACLGCCALAPVLVVDETAYGYCAPGKINDILDDYKEDE